MATDADVLRELKKLREAQERAAGSKVETKDLSDALKNAGSGVQEFAGKILRGGGELLGSYQQISKSGANFSQDILGMGKSAYESRLNLQEFGDIISKNSANLAGLGGNVTRGAEAFAKLSKGFFDDRSSAQLRDLGYTSKELNEVLALSVGMQKSTYKDTEEGRRRSIQAAQNLAIEMDAVAKLTGKSREQQMEEMKRAQVDGRVEAKMRLLAAGKSEDEIAQLKEEYQKGLLEAQKNGTEEMYKQFFATGTYVTKNAATQSALLGDQSRAMEEQIKAMQSGDMAKAQEARSREGAAAIKNANDTTLLNLATFGDAAGTAGSIAQKNVETTDAMYHSVKKVAEANGILLNTQQDYAKALKLTMEDIQASQGGRRRQVGADGKPTGPYQDVGGAGRAMVTTEMAGQDIKAAAASVAERASREDAQKLGALSDEYRRKQPARQFEKDALKGLEPVAPRDEEGRPKSAAQRDEEGGGVAGSIARGLKNLTDLTIGTVTNVFINGQKVPGRATGSAGTTGKIIEDFGQGTLAMLHGKEGVVTEDQMKNLAMGMKSEGIAGAVDQLKSSLPTPSDNPKSFAESMAESVRNGMKTVGVNPDSGKQQGVNIAELSKTVSTTVSAITGGGSTTTQRVQSDDSKSAEKELQSVKDQYAEERSALAAKFKEMMPEATAGERRRAMNASDESKALNAKYDALMKPLEKRIEDGIKWETDKKEEAVAVTKQAVEEELSVIKAGNLEQLSIKTMTEEEIAEKLQENAKDLNDYYIDLDGNLKSFASNAASTLGSAADVLGDDSDSDFSFEGKSSLGTELGQQIPPTSSAINLDMFNLPGMGGALKSQQATIAKAVAPQTKTEEERKQESEAAAKKAAAASTAKPPTPQAGSKASTLDDVVKSLDSLNMLMGQLISKTEDIGSKQVRATKNAGSGNVYKVS